MPINAYSIQIQPFHPDRSSLSWHLARIDVLLSRPWLLTELRGSDAGRTHDLTGLAPADRASLRQQYVEEHWCVTADPARPGWFRFTPPATRTMGR